MYSCALAAIIPLFSEFIARSIAIQLYPTRPEGDHEAEVQMLGVLACASFHRLNNVLHLNERRKARHAPGSGIQMKHGLRGVVHRRCVSFSDQ